MLLIRRGNLTDKVMEKKYTIDNKVYVQKPLLLGQWRQLIGIIKDIKISTFDTVGLIIALGNDIHKAIAVLLTEEGKHPKDKDVDALAKELDFAVTSEQIPEIIEDFLDITPTASLIEKLTGAFQKTFLKKDQKENPIGLNQ